MASRVDLGHGSRQNPPILRKKNSSEGKKIPENSEKSSDPCRLRSSDPFPTRPGAQNRYFCKLFYLRIAVFFVPGRSRRPPAAQNRYFSKGF